MTDAEKLLMALILKGLQGEKNDIEIPKETLRKVYNISRKHDLSHLVATALENTDNFEKNGEIGKLLKKDYQIAIYRYSSMEYEYTRIIEAFSSAHIPYISLKGMVIKGLYPEAWMRTSCDIDILIKECDIDRAIKVLVDTLGYKKERKVYHDISFISPLKIHLELHFSIKENMHKLDYVLSQVWDYAIKTDETSSEYRLTNEFLFFHNIAHLAYHFASGGCGIRNVLDIWLMKKSLEIDETVFNKLLCESNLRCFYEEIIHLSESWFEGKSISELQERMSNYIIQGGAYGTRENSVIIRQNKLGGKTRFLINRIFPPYKQMRVRYITLNKIPILLPFYWIVRLCEAMFGKRRASHIAELNTSRNISNVKKEEIINLLKDLNV